MQIYIHRVSSQKARKIYIKCTSHNFIAFAISLKFDKILAKQFCFFNKTQCIYNA